MSILECSIIYHFYFFKVLQVAEVVNLEMERVSDFDTEHLDSPEDEIPGIECVKNSPYRKYADIKKSVKTANKSIHNINIATKLLEIFFCKAH